MPSVTTTQVPIVQTKDGEITIHLNITIATIATSVKEENKEKSPYLVPDVAMLQGELIEFGEEK